MMKYRVLSIIFICQFFLLIGCSTTTESVLSTELSYDAPSSLTIADNTTSVKLTWGSNSEAKLYRVYRSLATHNNYELQGETTLPQFNDANVSFNVNYSYTVTNVYLGNIESPYSSVITIELSNTDSPSAPQSFSLSSDDRSITLDWEAPSDADVDFYYVFRATSENGNYTQLNPDPIYKTFTYYTDTTVTPEVTYWYKLNAQDVAGNESEYTDSISGYAIDSVAPDVINVLNSEVNETAQTVTITWDLSTDDDSDYYSVYRSDTLNTSLKLLTTLNITEDTYTETVPSLNYEYNYYLTVTDDTGNESGYSEPLNLFINDIIAPDQPTSLYGSRDDSCITLSWDENDETDIDGYNIYRSLSEDSGFEKININRIRDEAEYEDSESLSLTVSYNYYIVAIDLYGNISVSSDVYAIRYNPPIESFTITEGLVYETTISESDAEIATTSHTFSYLNSFAGYSGVYLETIYTTTTNAVSSVESRAYYRKSGGVIYYYLDESPFVGDNDSDDESINFQALVEDVADIEYRSSVLGGSITAIGYKTFNTTKYYTVTIDDGTDAYSYNALMMYEASGSQDIEITAISIPE